MRKHGFGPCVPSSNAMLAPRRPAPRANRRCDAGREFPGETDVERSVALSAAAVMLLGFAEPDDLYVGPDVLTTTTPGPEGASPAASLAAMSGIDALVLLLDPSGREIQSVSVLSPGPDGVAAFGNCRFWSGPDGGPAIIVPRCTSHAFVIEDGMLDLREADIAGLDADGYARASAELRRLADARPVRPSTGTLVVTTSGRDARTAVATAC